MAGPQGGGTITLTDAQKQYLTEQVNASGAGKTPPYVLNGLITGNTVLDIVVSGGGRDVAAQAKEKNGWESTDASFKQAVADVIAAIVW